MEQRAERAIEDLNYLLRTFGWLNGTKAASARFDEATAKVFAALVGRKPTREELARIGQ